MILNRNFDLYKKSYTFFFREESKGDNGVMGQVLEGKCFDLDRWHQGRVLSALYNDMVKSSLKPLIIDAGANIGASSLFFGARYPEAKIVSIEPALENIKLLIENTKSINADVISGGIAKEDGVMYLSDPGLGDWGFRVESSGATEVEVYSPNTILAKYNDFAPLVLKIDIEGGESCLFDDDLDWFRSFPVVIFEIHDWMLPFKGSSMDLFRAMSSGTYDTIFKGENIFFFNHSKLLKYHKPF
jgi:FkbM family methyltransferase